tara:strand:- start:661 stop:846 length:186 start_codon:yes stop_codon:yes gene_type:complete
MTEQNLYKILLNGTMGFTLISEDATNLTKDQCTKRLNSYVNEGFNPNDLKAVRVNDPRFPN